MGDTGTGQDTKEPWLIRLASGTLNRLTPLLQAVGTIGLALGAVWVSESDDELWPWITIGLAGAIELWGFLRAWREVPELENLKSERQHLRRELSEYRKDYLEACNDQLAVLSNEVLKLGDDDRVSVYKHSGHAFFTLGRYSKNPEFHKWGRGIYPEDQGCIQKAWLGGEATVNLPDPVSEPDEYYRVLEEEWEFDRGTAEALRMKSRTLAGFALEDPKATTRTAVLIIESIRPNAFDVSDLRTRLFSDEGRHIMQFLEQRRAQEPAPSLAAKEGF